MTADTARYPAPSRDQQYSPSPLPPPPSPSPSPGGGLERSGVSDGSDLCSQSWCVPGAGGGVGGDWWSLLADRSCNTSVVWWYRHWSYEQLQLSSQTLQVNTQTEVSISNTASTHTNINTRLLDTASSSTRADTSKWDSSSVLVDLPLRETWSCGPPCFQIVRLSQTELGWFIASQPQLHCDSD